MKNKFPHFLNAFGALSKRVKAAATLISVAAFLQATRFFFRNVLFYLSFCMVEIQIVPEIEDDKLFQVVMFLFSWLTG